MIHQSPPPCQPASPIASHASPQNHSHVLVRRITRLLNLCSIQLSASTQNTPIQASRVSSVSQNSLGGINPLHRRLRLEELKGLILKVLQLRRALSSGHREKDAQGGFRPIPACGLYFTGSKVMSFSSCSARLILLRVSALYYTSQSPHLQCFLSERLCSLFGKYNHQQTLRPGLPCSREVCIFMPD